jgi:hypothetical protein
MSRGIGCAIPPNIRRRPSGGEKLMHSIFYIIGVIVVIVVVLRFLGVY